MEKFSSNSDNYVTPGGKKYFRRVAIGYAVLACSVVAGIYGLTEKAKSDLIHNINKTVSELCVANIPLIQKENALRDVQIGVVTDTRTLNLEEGDTERARINTRYIKALEEAKRHVPTVEECMEELLD